MDLAGLRVVKAVADTGSVSRAAEALNCVQSNVTARIKRLEEDLGVDLFLRLSRGMEPTPAGRVLSGYADRVLRLVAQARDAVAEAAGRGGRLAVGSMESTAAVRLPPVLARFHRDHPDVELTITPGPTETLLGEVKPAQNLDVRPSVVHRFSRQARAQHKQARHRKSDQRLRLDHRRIAHDGHGELHRHAGQGAGNRPALPAMSQGQPRDGQEHRYARYLHQVDVVDGHRHPQQQQQRRQHTCHAVLGQSALHDIGPGNAPP